ncbi:hypothetical protein ACP275_03G076400 [Erythranthe tilingii]
MAHVLRPLIQWPRWWRHRHSALSPLLFLGSSSTRAATNPPFFAVFSTSYREAHSRSRGLKSRAAASSADVAESDGESSDGGGAKKSRNEKKREAHRAVRWGMDLASFSTPQIKFILRVAECEVEVFEALMVVKGLGRDVREGKRRQLNYIGKLLRDVEPELMDGLIQATKDGDQSKFQHLLVDDKEEEEDGEEEIEVEDEEEGSAISPFVTRWYDGLINKDVTITNEIYSLREVDFDRQELRQLVRKVQSALEPKSNLEENGKRATAAAVNARKSLTRFLQVLAEQLPAK